MNLSLNKEKIKIIIILMFPSVLIQNSPCVVWLKSDRKIYDECSIRNFTVFAEHWPVPVCSFKYSQTAAIQVIKHLELRGPEDLKFISLETWNSWHSFGLILLPDTDIITTEWFVSSLNLSHFSYKLPIASDGGRHSLE